MPSGMELGIIVIVILLLFGGKKIPELAKGLGSGIKNFKNALKEEDEVVMVKPEKNETDEIKLSKERIS
ncbi:twin-arginine translocase TatA/TatE family subunit [Aliarcobacter butzleri]|uniref:Sec-independent protein translocase protein TatA n=1 Tax=Aliarcobacter butzleri TaxID=28197 RepID=A0AAP4Q045_9BACT|nr:twin-arginine translocase TatA/TatE family subunit [Aliarcobacter butzleri]MCG3668534.1 twin-arginine translocase TatA/TatE family subunit [Aliarcobacter butzleri]MCG3683403.1 twin-arginine translocase TatA/TatE family subunit [Aliarcobacter butzleri]MCG3685597.1 twin-arginine translocase TatA/TatE family subunit [Aliarcobacter butzleri]MCG3707256.1 twin-arginine translocase TatA/TatE family subunit [Aliarcobacter butzleri]MCG3710124.1 twin-arginine translocase TatA/TatE family subunit [Ali